MAVDWEDLVTPEGELDVALLFPDDSDDGEARLTGYIADGVTRIGSLTGDAADAATTLWAEYRAYLAKYQTKLDDYLNITKQFPDAGTKTTSQLWSQIQAWKLLADERLAQFEGAVGEVDIAGDAALPRPAVVPLVYTW